MDKKSHNTKIALALFGSPIMIVSIPLLLLEILPVFKIYIVNSTIALVMISYPLFFYFLWILQKVPYTDPDVLDRIILNVPREVEKQLKSFSKKHFVSNDIILYLGNSNRRPSQTEITNFVGEIGVDLSSTQIRKILAKLEGLKLISSQRTVYERDYALTKKGIWCNEAIKYYFPKRNFWFILKNQLIKKDLPPFPEQN